MVINMPIISDADLEKLLREQFPTLRPAYAEQLAGLFGDIRQKCDSSEISTKPLDLRGLLAAVALVGNGLALGPALELGLVNKSFDEFERQLVSDLIAARVSGAIGAAELFDA